MKKNLPLNRRFPRLTHLADWIYHNDENGARPIIDYIWFFVGLLVASLVFTLTDYSFWAKIAVTMVIFGFLFFLVVLPLLVLLCLFRSDDC